MRTTQISFTFSFGKDKKAKIELCKKLSHGFMSFFVFSIIPQPIVKCKVKSFTVIQ